MRQLLGAWSQSIWRHLIGTWTDVVANFFNLKAESVKVKPIWLVENGPDAKLIAFQLRPKHQYSLNHSETLSKGLIVCVLGVVSRTGPISSWSVSPLQQFQRKVICHPQVAYVGFYSLGILQRWEIWHQGYDQLHSRRIQSGYFVVSQYGLRSAPALSQLFAHCVC